MLLVGGCLGSSPNLNNKSREKLSKISDDKIYKAALNDTHSSSAVIDAAYDRLPKQSDDRLLKVLGGTRVPFRTMDRHLHFWALDIARVRNIFTEKEIKMLKKHHIFPGMSKKALKTIWGQPNQRNTIEKKNSVEEHYLYGEPPFGQVHIVLENGEVQSYDF